MNDLFIYGLLFSFLLLFFTLKSAFNSVSKLQLELDKKKAFYHVKILNFISSNTAEFSITVNICYFISLTTAVLFIKINLIETFHFLNHFQFYILFVLVIGLMLFPVFKIFPQTLGEYFPNELINALAIFLITTYILFFPITKIVLFLRNTPFRIIYKDDIRIKQKTNFDKEDLNKFVSDSRKHNPKNEEIDAEIRLFENALDFAEVKIRACMIPRTEIIAVEVAQLENELKEKFISSGYSKILVFNDSIENIFGYIKSKSLFHLDVDLKNEIKNIKFFPESMPANKLLRFFIKSGQNIAVVVDEFGGVSGIVTIEDILEEIFGEIKDEHDSEDLFEKKLSDQDFIFSGRIETDYLSEKYGLHIPENEDYETLAGFILYHTENFPGINDQIKIENFKFTILKLSKTRVELVKLEITHE